jgi:nicotinamidase-related amidase
MVLYTKLEVWHKCVSRTREGLQRPRHCRAIIDTGAFMTKLLLIIDVQKGFINDATGHIPDRVEALAADYEQVFVTRFVNPPGSSHRRFIHWDRFAPGDAETALAFTPPEGAEIIEKSSYSCVDEALLTRIKACGTEEVHICGIATDNCVLCSAVDLFEAGIRPVVLTDACASHGGAELHQWGLRILARLIGADQLRGAEA